MENNNKRKTTILIVSLIIIILGLGVYIVIDKLHENKVLDERSKCVEVNTEETTTAEEVTSVSTTEQVKDNCKEQKGSIVDKNNIRNLYDSYNYNDPNVVKAQKIAKELVYAVNNKDYYYLAKIVGIDADLYIKYDIKNYSIDTNNYQVLENEFVFKEVFEASATPYEDVGFGDLLVIKFEDGGRIVIDSLCTGM